MSFSGGVFSINTAGQPVVDGTVISASVFNALTADLATGLSTCVLKDGTQITTAVVPFAAGLSTPDASFTIYDDGDNTKIAKFQCSSITAGATRTFTLPDQSSTVAVTGNNLGVFAATTSAQLAGVISDETGSGALVFANSPTLVTPVLGIPASGNLSNCTGIPMGSASGTLGVANGGTGTTSLTANAVLLGNGTSAVQTVAASTSGNILRADGTTWASAAQVTLGTNVATTSGTAANWTGIPSYVKKITLTLQGVSTNGTSNPIVQLGTSGGVVTTNYVSTSCSMVAGGATAGTTYTAGFGIASGLAANALTGHIVITNLTGNLWACSINLADMSGTTVFTGAGYITAANLGGVLDRVRLTTVGGADTFDAGNANIMYE